MKIWSIIVMSLSLATWLPSCEPIPQAPSPGAAKHVESTPAMSTSTTAPKTQSGTYTPHSDIDLNSSTPFTDSSSVDNSEGTAIEYAPLPGDNRNRLRAPTLPEELPVTADGKVIKKD